MDEVQSRVLRNLIPVETHFDLWCISGTQRLSAISYARTPRGDKNELSSVIYSHLAKGATGN